MYKFTPTHEWISFDDSDKTQITMGITDYAQSALGDIVFVDLPTVGDSFQAKRKQWLGQNSLVPYQGLTLNLFSLSIHRGIWRH